MTKEEFLIKAKEQEDWAPGWDIIDSVFEDLYPNQEPEHFATEITSRSIFGGDDYLDGYSIYTSKEGYKHIVTYGMTELYANEEFFGGKWNKWGYEMTIKLAEKDTQDCMWAIDMLSNLARYTFEEERFFEPFQFISGNGKSICLDRDSKITALMTIEDTQAKGLDTIYGRTDFIQLVGITEQELDKLKEDRENAKKLYELMKMDNPNFVLDLNRTKSYI